MLRVAFVDFIFETRADIKLEGCQFSIHPPLRTADEIVTAAEDADILCMRDQFGKVTRDVFERLPNLKYIITRSAGYDHIDLEEARKRGIPVSNIPDYGAHMIAEQAFGLLLAVARNIVKGNERYKRERLWSDKGFQGIELLGKTLGVIGTGRIGLGFTYTSLENLLAESDMVTLHVSLNESTHHLINADRLAQMKPGALLINTSRGDVVDTQAVMDALRSEHLAGAGLDVLEDERNRYHDFGDLNVIVTPHLGWYTDGAVDRILKITMEDISGYIDGNLINLV